MPRRPTRGGCGAARVVPAVDRAGGSTRTGRRLIGEHVAPHAEPDERPGPHADPHPHADADAQPHRRAAGPLLDGRPVTAEERPTGPVPEGGAGFELGDDGPKVIVVGIDGSQTSLRAGAYAAGLARRQGARLVAVSVATPPALAALAPGRSWPVEETLAAVTDEIRQEVAAGAAHTGVRVEFVAVRGDAYVELCRVASETRADAVVVGASTQLGHRVMGSLAVRLVRAGRWPVTVVP
ncbi:MAG: universal stress protein UspA [Frankiales bacterium]|nr:universal stress protein UspA [Frankiales bacterium]